MHPSPSRALQSILLILTLPVILVASGAATTYVIRADGTGDFPTIQAAVDAVADEDIIELTDGAFVGDGNRDVDFQGKAIAIRSQSGNPESCILDCQGSELEPHRGFLFRSGEGPDACLDGIGIWGGWAADLPFGGAIACTDASHPTITDCVLRGNQGTGLACERSSPTIARCTFEDNRGNLGGGLRCMDGANPLIIDCIFLANQADWSGGGVHGSGSGATLRDCTFDRNTATHGAAIYFRSNSSPTLESCLITGNVAEHSSGGIHIEQLCAATIRQCTLAGNRAQIAGGISVSIECLAWLSGCTLFGNAGGWCGGILCGEYSQIEIESSIIAFSPEGEALLCSDSEATLICCDLFGNAGGDWVGQIADQLGVNGNICEDPLFCDPAGDDLTIDCYSPCAPFSPPNPECDLIGDWPVGCGGSPARETSWGILKSLFRD